MRFRKKQKRENYFRYKTRSLITVYFSHVSADTFNQLSQDDRYCLLLLGHIHDEISLLQRMAYVSAKSVGGYTEIEDVANQMQTTMIARLLLGKLFEFKKVMSIEGSPIPNFITKNFHIDDERSGKAQFDSIIDYFNREKWIRVARNKHILHYPNLEDVIDTLEGGEIIWDYDIYHGKHSANTFHRTSDVLANLSWFRLAKPNEPLKGLEEALTTIRELSMLSLTTLEQSIGNFINTNLIPLKNHKKIRINVRDNINKVRMNYFMDTI